MIIVNYLQEQLRIFNQYLQCSEKLDSVGKQIQSHGRLHWREWLDRKLKLKLSLISVEAWVSVREGNRNRVSPTIVNVNFLSISWMYT